MWVMLTGLERVKTLKQGGNKFVGYIGNVLWSSNHDIYSLVCGGQRNHQNRAISYGLYLYLSVFVRDIGNLPIHGAKAGKGSYNNKIHTFWWGVVLRPALLYSKPRETGFTFRHTSDPSLVGPKVSYQESLSCRHPQKIKHFFFF